MFFIVVQTTRNHWLILASVALRLSVALRQPESPSCGRGQYFNFSMEVCAPCPPNTYMTRDNHKTAGCINCRKPVRNSNCHQAVLQNCTSEHATVIGCQDGYFINSSQESVECHLTCSRCTTCQHAGQKCGHDNDAVCCPQPGMVVSETEDGPECKLPDGDPLSRTTRSIDQTATTKSACAHKVSWKCQTNWHTFSPGMCMKYESETNYETAVESCASQGASLLGEGVDLATYVCMLGLSQNSVQLKKIWLKRRHSETNPKVLDLVSKTVFNSTSWDDQYPHVCLTHVKEKDGVVVPDCPQGNVSFCRGCLQSRVFTDIMNATLWCSQQGGSLVSDTVDSTTMSCIAAVYPLETSGGFKLQNGILYLVLGKSQGRKNVYFCLTSESSVTSSLADDNRRETMSFIVVGVAVFLTIFLMVAVGLAINRCRAKLRGKHRSPSVMNTAVYQNEESEIASQELRALRGDQGLQYENQETDVEITLEKEIMILEHAGSNESAIYTEICEDEERQREDPRLTSHHKHSLRSESIPRVYEHSPVSREWFQTQTVCTHDRPSTVELRTLNTSTRMNTDNVVNDKNKVAKRAELSPEDEQLVQTMVPATYENYCDHIYETVSSI